jgi:sarcosine oxidase, subunit beta
VAGRRAVCIGAGITGVLVARELLLAGWEVTILEGRHVGAGSSSRTAAGIRQQFSTPETVRGMQYAVRFYEAFQAEIEDGTSPIVQNGYLFLHAEAERWAAARERAEMQRACGLGVEVLEGAALRRAFPWVAEALLGGTFCPTDGFLLPHLIYNEGARRVRALGGRVVQNAPVVGTADDGARIREVNTPSGSYGADLFVDCTNAWARRTGEVLGAEPLPVDPLKRYLWFLARDGALSEDELARMPLVVGPTGVYVRPENQGSLLMGKAYDVPPEPAFDDEDQDRVAPAFSHTAGVDGAAVQAWMEIAEAVPAVGEFAGLTATACGYYGTTPDHNPFLGFDPRRPNLIRLVGFSGHGAMFGPFTAAVAAALAEAGRDVPEVVLDGAAVGIGAFRIGRPLGQAEQMVI